MRRITLIRHAMPDIPLGERWCVGRTDLPLGTVGRMQAALLPFVPELSGRPVFCSRLSRAVKTARPLCPAPEIREGLEEQDMGLWDGLSFSEIRVRFPELYAARGKDPGLMPPGSESMEAVRSRMEAAVRGILRETEGDPVIVSHKSAIASLTGHREALDYISLSVLDEDLQPLSVGQSPHPALTGAVCAALLQAAGTPEPVAAHCRAVAEEALHLAEGFPVDRDLLYTAALLHDLARTEARHAETGAAWLRALGYPEHAAVIARHHDCESGEIDEAALLFLADKYIRHTQRVSLEERFRESEKKCISPEARDAHQKQYEQAVRLEKLVLYRS